MASSSNAFIQALASSSWIDVGRDSHITYAMSSAYGVGWTDEQKQVFAAVLQSYADVSNLSFELVTDDSAADIVEYQVTSAQFAAAFPASPYGPYGPNWAGYHYSPIEAEATGPVAGYFDEEKIGSWLEFHELLHGLGLEHPHTAIHGTGVFPGVTVNAGNDLGDYGLNNSLNTLMSYAFLPGFQAAEFDGPMAMDIAALQLLYGVNSSTGAGDDVYVVARDKFKAIWDTAGVDWLVAGTDNGSVLDLRPATLALGDSAGGWLSTAVGFIGGYSIAHGVEIENARGGAGADILVGNNLINRLEGGEGNDTYYTNDARDIIVDTGGFDTLYSYANTNLGWGNGIERIYLLGPAKIGAGNELNNIIIAKNDNGVKLWGYWGDDAIAGGGGNDIIYGGSGNDTLIGNVGADVLVGGVGSDKFVFNRIVESTNSRRDFIVDFQKRFDVIDLHTIDASTKAAGNQAFTWIGSNAFHGVAGELQYSYIDQPGTKADRTVISADVNGDRVADMKISLLGLVHLGATDFIL